MIDRPMPPSRQATEAALHFLAELQAGRHPRIEDSLAATPPDEWKSLLQSLLIAEVNYRKRRGEIPSPRDYLPRFPGFASIVRSVLPDLPTTIVVRDGIPVGLAVETTQAAAETASEIPTVASLTAIHPAPPDTAHNAGRTRRRLPWKWMSVAGVVIAVTSVLLFVLRSPPPEADPEPSVELPPATAPALVAARTPKGKPNLSPADADRELAEWAVSLNGGGGLKLTTGGRRSFGPDDPLPAGKFTVTELVIPAAASDRWGPSDLERLLGCSGLAAIRLHVPMGFSETALAPLNAPHVRSLELFGNEIEISGLFLARFPELETITLLSAPEFADADMVAIGKLPRLKTLSLNSPKITPAGFKALRSPDLKVLAFGPDMHLSAEHIRFLQGLSLETFESAAGMTDDAFLEFAVVPTLKRVHLRRTTLTDAGLKAVLGFGRLEEFQVIESAIEGPGLDHLAEHPALRVLNLTGARIPDDAIGKMLALPALRELRLAACPVTDQSAVLLAQLDRLEVLDLSDTAITDVTLGVLKKHQTLKQLLLTNTQVTERAVRDFEAGTPNCRVEWGPRKK